MAEQIVDSNVFIDFFRGRPEAIDAVNRGYASGEWVTHVAVLAEVLSGARNKREQLAFERFFAKFKVVPATDGDLLIGLEYLKRYRLSHGVSWLDAVIATTALRRNSTVITCDIGHFSIVAGLRVERPY